MMKTPMDEVEAIDQQFDEVLKFLAQTIEDRATSPQSSSSPSSMSLTTTPNTDSKKTPDLSSGSSNSSGIGDEYYHNEQPKKQIVIEDSRTPKMKLNNDKVFKRNSSDSAYLETVSMPSSLSLTGISNNHIMNLNNQNKISENQYMMNQNVNQPFMNISSSSSSGGSSEPSPKSTEPANTVIRQAPVNYNLWNKDLVF